MIRMTWRDIRKPDLLERLLMRPANLGNAIVGRDAAIAVWYQLLESAVFDGIVIEAEPPISGHRIVSCGARVFVSPDFMSAEIANPRPGLNSNHRERSTWTTGALEA